ncbi:MAG TPA: hypothetical protein VGX00_04930 [Thermoplasmata archaeon]|nr:hypothetical protein [Thermoplasmata archaeon]
MAGRGHRRAPSRRSWGPLLAGILLSLALTLPWAAEVGRTGPASGSAPNRTLGGAVGPWDNGVITLAFSNPLPSFSVASDRNPQIASAHTFDEVAELTPSGNLTAYSPLRTQNLSWGVVAQPSAGGTMVWLNATVPVFSTTGTWGVRDELAPMGLPPRQANLSLCFTLNGSSAGSPGTVRFVVGVAQWPWVNFQDSLGMEIGSAAVPSTTLRAGPAPDSIIEVANGTGSTVATLSWATSASVGYVSGPGGTSTVGALQTFSTDESTSTVLFQFSAPRGGYTELEYDPWIALNLSAFPRGVLPAWTLTDSALESIALAAGVAAILALVAARSRSGTRPKD